jgi:hypothetical protein
MTERAAPSLAAVAVSSLILGLLAGYFLGQASSIGVFGSAAANPKKSWPNSYDVKVHADSSDEADDEDEQDEGGEEADGAELKDFKDSREEVKLVLCVRTDLGMTKGSDMSRREQTDIDLLVRQDRSAVFPRNPCMLQISHQSHFLRVATETVGVWWPT